MFIMSVGLLGLAGLQSTAVKDGLDVAKRSQVTWIVSELVERIRANPNAVGVPADPIKGTPAVLSVYDVLPANILDCTALPAKRCADNPAGNAQACTAAEMAAFDAWDAFCGWTDPGGIIIANSQDSLNLTSVAITCSGGGVCTGDSDYTITIAWTSQTVLDNTNRAAPTGATSAPGYTASTEASNRTISMVIRPGL